MRIRYGGTNFVRTDVSAANCTSGRKCLYRLDVIVCDVSYMTGVGCRCYSVIICIVHTISFISISFNRFAGVVVIVVVRIVRIVHILSTINLLLSRSWFISIGWLTYERRQCCDGYRIDIVRWYFVVRWYWSGTLLEESRHRDTTQWCSMESNVYYTTMTGLWLILLELGGA